MPMPSSLRPATLPPSLRDQDERILGGTRKMVRQAQQQQGGGDSGGRWCSTFKGGGGSGDAAWISCCAAGAETSRKLKYEESLSLVPSAQLSTPPQWSLNLAGLSVGGDVCVCVCVRVRAHVRAWGGGGGVCGGWALLQLFPKPRRQWKNAMESTERNYLYQAVTVSHLTQPCRK